MDNIKFVNDLYDAFKRGDLQYILERFGDLENSGVLADSHQKAPWHFALVGPKATAKYFEALLGTMEPIRVEATNLAAAGEYVYATVAQEWKVRASGKVLSMRDGAHRFRIRGGKVIEWRAFEDTALTTEVLGV